MKKLLAIILATLLLCMASCGSADSETASPAPSEQEPTETWSAQRPLSIIVPGAAGGDTDINTRIFAKYLQDVIGQTVVITNISGVPVAMEEFKNAAADGYTAYVHHPGMMVASLLGTIDSKYSDFKTPGIFAIDKQSAWFVSKNAPFKTLDELAAASKLEPIGFATEVGSMSHLTELMFMEQVEGTQFNIVDAGGSADKITALLSGQLDLMFNQVGLVTDYMTNGDFICLGIMSDERSDFNPDIPTFIEQGYNITLDKPYWIMFSPETDDAIISYYEAAFQKVFENDDYAEELGGTMQTEPAYMTADESLELLDEINSTYSELLANFES